MVIALKDAGRDTAPTSSALAFLRTTDISSYFHHLRSWSDLLGVSAGFATIQSRSVL